MVFDWVPVPAEETTLIDVPPMTKAALHGMARMIEAVEPNASER